MSQLAEPGLTLEDHEQAFTEVSFLLEMLINTVNTVVGKSAPSLGTNAGRHAARKLPVVLQDPDLAAAVGAAASSLAPGFELTVRCQGNEADLSVGRCVVREVCKNRNLPLDGDLCRMFHYYLAGVTAQLLGRAVRPGAVSAGEVCTIRLDAQH